MEKKNNKCKISSLSAFSRQLLLLLLRPAIILPALLFVLIHSFSQVNFNELARRLAIYHLTIETGWEIKISELNFSKKGEIKIRKLIAHDKADDDVVSIPLIIVKYDLNRFLNNPGAPVAAITAVNVNSPQFIVRRNKAGKWNFDHLLQTKPHKPTPINEKLQAEITIANGHLLYTDKKGWGGGIAPLNEELNDINLVITPTRSGAMPFQFSAYDATKKLQKISTGGTINIDTNGALVRTDVYNIDIRRAMKTFAKVLPADMPLTIDNGTIDMRFQLAINGNAPPLLSAVIDLKNLRGKTIVEVPQNVKNKKSTEKLVLPFEIKYGNFDLNENGISISGINVKLAQAPITVSGTITDMKKPIFNLHISADKIEPTKIVKLIGSLRRLGYSWQGKLNIDVDFSGTTDLPVVRAKLSGVDLGTEFGDFSNISGEVKYADDIITISKIQTGAFGGMIKGDLWINGGSYKKPFTLAALRGYAQDIKPEEIRKKFDKKSKAKTFKEMMTDYSKVNGNVSGDIALKVTQYPKRNKKNRTGTIKAELITDLRGKMGVAIPISLAGEFAMAGNVVIVSDEDEKIDTTVSASLSHLQLKTPDGIIRASGRLLTDEKIIVDVQLSELNLAILQPFIDIKNVSGKGYLSGTASGYYLNPSFAGRFHIEKPQGMGYKVDDIVGDCELSLTPDVKIVDKYILDKLSFTNMVISANNSHIRGSFLVKNKNGKPQTNIMLKIPRTSISDIATIAGIKGKIPFDGIVEGDCQLKDITENPGGNLDLIIHQPEVDLPELHLSDGRKINHTTLNGTKLELDVMLKDGIAFLNKSSCDLGGINILVTGQIPVLKKNAPVILKWELPDIDLRDIAIMTKTVQPNLPENITTVLDNIDHYATGEIAVNGNTTFIIPDFTDERFAVKFIKSFIMDVQVAVPNGLKIAGIPYTTFNIAGSFSGNDMIYTVRTFEFARNLSKRKYSVKLIDDFGPGMLWILPNNKQEIDFGFKIEAENVNQIRRDIMQLASLFETIVPLQTLSKTVQAIPTPFSAVNDMTINISGALNQPLIDTKVKLSKLMVGNIDIENVDTHFTYDGGPNQIEAKLKLKKVSIGDVGLLNVNTDFIYDGSSNKISITNLLIDSEEDKTNKSVLQGVSVDMNGDLTFPGADKQTGQIDMSVNAQQIDLAIIGKWLNIPVLQQFKGKASIIATVYSDMEKPNIRASVDIEKPEYMNNRFDMLSMVVTIDEEGIWLGKWLKRENAPTNLTPVKNIENKIIFEEGAGTLSYISDNKNQVEPLQIYGYIPFEWSGPLLPNVPVNKDCYIELRLPKQGLSCVRPFMPAEMRKVFPKIDNEDGKIESLVKIGGPIFSPVLTDGNLQLTIPHLTLEQVTQDIPEKLNRVNLDINFHPNANNKTLTVLDIRDFSAVFDRPVVNKKTSFSWVKKMLGIKEIKLPPNGSFVAKGTILVDPDKLQKNGIWIPAADFPSKLRYDIKLQSIRAPIRWREAFNGTVTAFLRLHNRLDSDPEKSLPILEGLAYAENSRLGYDETKKTSEPITLPINPELSVALILGENNSFDIVMPPNIAVKLPFTPTKLLQPLSALDMEIAAKGEKLPITNSFVFAINSKAMTDYAEKYGGTDTVGIGTYGMITGRLIKPVIDVDCIIDSSDAKIQLPGGNLNITSGRARFSYINDTPSLVTQAEATGQVDEFAIIASIGKIDKDNKNIISGVDLLDPNISTNSSWLKIETSYAPTGKNPLTQEEIFSRLFGLSDVMNTFNSNKDTGSLTLLSKMGTSIALPRVADMIRGSINRAFGTKVIETVNLAQSYDKTGTQLSLYPSISATTIEFFKTKYTSFRLGGSTTFVSPTDWKLWLTYRVPKNKLLNNFNITAETNSEHKKNISLQYKFGF